MKYDVNENLEAGQQIIIHKWEKAGLGKAPYAYLGMGKGSTSCCYCGTGIKYLFNFRSADGKTFYVGSNCVHSSDDAGLTKLISQDERKLRDEQNKERAERKQQKAFAYFQEAEVYFEGSSELFKALPHPNKYMSKDGKTLFDYLSFCREHGPKKFTEEVFRVRREHS